MEITIGEGENAKTVNVLDELINDKKTIKIKEGKDNTYSFKKNILTFNPSKGIAFFKDANKPYNQDSNGKTVADYGKNSPASVLSHELIHGYNDFFDKGLSKRLNDFSTRGQIKDPYGRDFSFANAEEKFTTTLANQVNEHLQEDQRTNYAIIPYPVKGVTTTEPITPIPLE
nr:M91 family zinc metallopeptidase [Flavobacterium soli]